MKKHLILGLCLAGFLFPVAMDFGIASASEDQVANHGITLGAVQSKIKVGVTGEDVIMALGSPNIVTSGDSGTETWIYDKLSLEQESQAAVVGSAKVNDDSDEARATVEGMAKTRRTRTERTMMVIVKFDANKKVSNVQYRESAY